MVDELTREQWEDLYGFLWPPVPEPVPPDRAEAARLDRWADLVLEDYREEVRSRASAALLTPPWPAPGEEGMPDEDALEISALAELHEDWPIDALEVLLRLGREEHLPQARALLERWDREVGGDGEYLECLDDLVWEALYPEDPEARDWIDRDQYTAVEMGWAARLGNDRALKLMRFEIRSARRWTDSRGAWAWSDVMRILVGLGVAGQEVARAELTGEDMERIREACRTLAAAPIHEIWDFNPTDTLWMALALAWLRGWREVAEAHLANPDALRLFCDTAGHWGALDLRLWVDAPLPAQLDDGSVPYPQWPTRKLDRLCRAETLLHLSGLHPGPETALMATLLLRQAGAEEWTWPEAVAGALAWRRCRAADGASS